MLNRQRGSEALSSTFCYARVFCNRWKLWVHKYVYLLCTGTSERLSKWAGRGGEVLSSLCVVFIIYLLSIFVDSTAHIT